MSQVAKNAEFVSGGSTMVKINQDALERFSSMLFDKVTSGAYRSVHWSRDNPLHPQTITLSTLDWIFLVDSLNFSFWPTSGQHFSIESQVGYWALCAAINRAEREGIPITTPEYYQNITEDQARSIFRTDQPEREIPLLAERVKIMQHNGRALCEHFRGTFKTVVEQATGSAQQLLDLVCEHFPSFRDEAVFQDRSVKVLKRAQILVADIWGCYEGRGLGNFRDIDSLTMFADYRIPQALHFFGVLEYSSELLELLKSDRLLENGSQPEVEIRCNSIHAVERIRGRLLELLKETGSGTGSAVPNSIELDFYIWGFRRDNAEEIDKKSPYHKVRCIYY